MSLITDPRARKEYDLLPVLRYFHDALAEVSKVIKVGQQQHGTSAWDRSKSGDELPAAIRHAIEAGTLDETDGVRHSAKLAWRALANLQKELERDLGLPISVGSVPGTPEARTLTPVELADAVRAHVAEHVALWEAAGQSAKAPYEAPAAKEFTQAQERARAASSAEAEAVASSLFTRVPESARFPVELPARKLTVEDLKAPENALAFNWVPMWPDHPSSDAQKCTIDGYILRAYTDGDVEINPIVNGYDHALSGFVDSGAVGNIEATKRFAERLYLFRREQSATK